MSSTEGLQRTLLRCVGHISYAARHLAYILIATLVIHHLVVSCSEIASAAELGARMEVVVITKPESEAERYIHSAVSRTVGGAKTVFGSVSHAEISKLKAMKDVIAVIPRKQHSDLLHIIDHDLPDKRRRSRRDIRRQVKAMRRTESERVGKWESGNRLPPDFSFSEKDRPEFAAHDISIDGAVAAWRKGFTGAGVNIAVIDSGVDFAHPDLFGAQARQPFGPYKGWPIAFDDRSMTIYATTGKTTGTWYVDTSFSTTETVVDFSIPDRDGKPIVHTYTLPPTSKSGVYHLGAHPDNTLAQIWYGERPAVLVADETIPGVYDTVYVDLNDNFDFTDDKPCRRGDEVSYIDSWDAFNNAPGRDGYADLSGGMVYYIADGVDYLPAFDWLWAKSLPAPPRVPRPGEMVAFMLDDVTLTGGAHGTMVASNIVGRGIINGRAPTWKPLDIGAVRGAARDAKVIAMGNFYEGGCLTDYYWFAALGYDGIANSGDEAQIVNISYKSSLAAENNEWDFESRFLTWLNLKHAPRTTFVAASGNGAPNYGTVAAPSPSTGIDVGATTYFGWLGVFDSISGLDQIVSGDVSPFSGRGPTACGDLAPDVVAGGGWSAGCIPLNEIGDGWNAWGAFGGTSRACAVASGNLALICDAYRRRHNVFPTYDVARQILMSSAENVSCDPLTSGAGIVNSDRGTDIASGEYGVYVSPDSWRPGGFRGREYKAFASIVHPGKKALKQFTIHNPSAVDVTVSLSDGVFRKIGSQSIEIVSDSRNESDYDFNRPDYLIDLTPQIPQETELLEVRALYSGEMIDDEREKNQQFRLLAYDWKDVNGDDALWSDSNGNGTVNEGEIEQDEYIRFSYAFSSSGSLAIRIQRPLERIHDGLFLGIQHSRPRRRAEREGLSPTTIRIESSFYARRDWSLLSVTPKTLTVPAGGSAEFQGSFRAPRSQPPGVYEGCTFIDDPGDDTHTARRITIPVVVNVAASVNLRALMSGKAVTIGGASGTDTLYPSGALMDPPAARGEANRALKSNWKYFFLDILGRYPLAMKTGGHHSLSAGDSSPPGNGAPILWGYGSQQRATDKGDEDTPLHLAVSEIRVMNPVVDDFSERSSPFYDPSFGPYALDLPRGDAGKTASIAPGLNLIATPFRVSISSLSLRARPRRLTFKARRRKGRAKIRVTSSVDLPRLHAVAYGLGESELLTNLPARQDERDDPSSASWTKDITINDCGLLEVRVGMRGRRKRATRDDLDLYVLYDANSDGVFSWPGDASGSEVIASSTGRGAGERVAMRFPKDGAYRIAVHGYSVESDAEKRFDVSTVIAQGNDLSIAALSERPAKAGKPKTFILIYNKSAGASRFRPNSWRGVGIVYIGPSDPPWELRIPVEIEFVGEMR